MYVLSKFEVRNGHVLDINRSPEYRTPIAQQTIQEPILPAATKFKPQPTPTPPIRNPEKRRKKPIVMSTSIFSHPRILPLLYLQRSTLRTTPLDLLRRPTFSRRLPRLTPPQAQTQIATMIRVIAIKINDPTLPPDHYMYFAAHQTHKLPLSALGNNEKEDTYEVNVLIADDERNDTDMDECWRFEILDGENEMDRLWTYARAFRRKLDSEGQEAGVHMKAFQRDIRRLWQEKYIGIRGEKETGFEQDEGVDPYPVPPITVQISADKYERTYD